MSAKELEPIEPSTRPGCIRFTTERFIPAVYSLGMRRGIEERYLGDDLYTVGEGMRRITRLHSVDLAVAQRVEQLGDPGLALTEGRLQEYITQAEQTKKAWGVVVANRARELGLVENVTPREADTKVETNLLTNLAELVFEEGFLDPRGWRIFPSKQGENPILLMPHEGELSLDSVDLDSLYRADPAFLRQQIENYHEVSAVASLAFSIKYNLGYHDLSPDELLPEFVRELGKLEGDDQQAKQIHSILLFLDYLEWLGTLTRSLADILKEKLSNLHASMPDGRTAAIRGYLAHLSACPSETSAVRLENAGLEAAYERLLSGQSGWAAGAGRFSDKQRLVLADPDRIVFNLSVQETGMRQEREIDQAFSNFIASTADITDQDQLLEALQQQLPDIYESFVQLKKWLGTDYFGKSQLDEHISKAAQTISSGGSETTLAQLQEASRDLGYVGHRPEKGEFNGVFINRTGKTSLHHSHLRGVISLLAIKSAQVYAEGRKQDMHLADFYNRKVSQCRGLTDELGVYFNGQAEEKNSMLQRWAEDRTLFADLRSQVGITDEEITSSLVQTGEKAWKYNLNFSLLFLHKQGLIDMHSPIFKAFLRFYLPSFQES